MFASFLGSEESILEYNPDRTAVATVATGRAIDSQRHPSSMSRVDGTGSALSDLIRSPDFVIDFPRIFVLNAGGATGNRDAILPTRLPERSQSSLSLAHAKDWISLMTNKLEEQHGLQRMRKTSARCEMQANLLGVGTESLKKRRSRSADGRYSSGFFGRKELQLAMAQAEDGAPVAPTDDTCSQFKQSQREKLDFTNARRRRCSWQRSSEVSLRDLPFWQAAVRATSNGHPSGTAAEPSRDIKIQINGAGIDFD